MKGFDSSQFHALPKGTLREGAIGRAVAELVERGVRRLEWARTHMPVLHAVREALVASKALKGLKIGMALHTEAKTGVLALSLQEAGAKVRLDRKSTRLNS